MHVARHGIHSARSVLGKFEGVRAQVIQAGVQVLTVQIVIHLHHIRVQQENMC